MAKNMKNKSIAILGGMGPQASSKLLETVIRMASKDFGAKNDSDFPEIILNSIPVPDFIANDESVDIVFQTLKRRVKSLERFNPVNFSIACNTAHILLPRLQAETNVPFVSIIEQVSACVSEPEIKVVGLLATPTTIKSGLYQESLKEKGAECIILSNKDQRITEQVIRSVLAGKIKTNDRKKLVKLAEKLRENGAEGIILGCTELPLLFPKQFNLPVFDSIEILARVLLKNFYAFKGGDKND